MKIIIATDFHLSNRLYGLEELENEFYTKFNEMIDEIVMEEPDLFLQLGDIFDSPYPKPIAIKTFQEGLEKLKMNGIPCYGILGNHTIVRRKGFYPIDKIFKDMTLLENDYVTFDDVFIGGVGYHSKLQDIKSVIDELYEASKGYVIRILLLHQGLKNDIGIGYDFDEEELALNRFDYVFLGHFHKKIMRMDERTGTVYHYPGSLNSCNITEMGDEMKYGRGYSVFDTETLELSMRVLEMTHKFLQYNLNDIQLNWEIVESMVKSLKEYPNKPIIQLNIVTNNAHDIYKMLKILEEYVLTIKYNINASEYETLIQNDTISPTSDIDELLRDCYDEEWKGNLAVELFHLLRENRIEEAKEIADITFRKQYTS